MNKFSEMTDFEINKLVAYLFLDDGYFEINSYRSEVMYFPTGSGEGLYRDYDPCNNPSDAMPIVIENGISLVPFVISKPVAYDSSKGLILGATAENDNVLRAAMEVFLMMKDSE